METKYMKKCSTPLDIKEMQIYFTIRVPIIKETLNAGEDGGMEETLLDGWWGCNLVQSLWKSVWTIIKKLKTDLVLYNQSIPLLGIHLKQHKSTYRGTCTPMFVVALYKSQTVESV
jgi:hypothetical protein